MEAFFSALINFYEEGKELKEVTSFEATNSVFNKTDENKSFSISSPSYLTPNDGEETNNKLSETLEPTSQNDIELYVKEAEKRSTRKVIENSRCTSAGFDHF